jgi:hypothetical protein
MGSTSQAPRDTALGDVVAEHEQFAVDPRSAPGWVFRNHLENQLTDLFRDRSSAERLMDSGDEPPIQLEARPMPAHNRIGRHDDERSLPGRPEAAQPNPEDFVDDAQLGASVLAFENGQLLTEGEILDE